MRLSALRERNPLPEGTLPIVVGLGLAGASQYGFLAIGARALGPEAYAPLATFWSMLFILGPGFFLPLEQEVGRALGARRARGEGGAPLVRRALVAGLVLAAVLAATALLLSGPIADRFYRGEGLFVAALAAGLVAYACVHTTRGTLSGTGHFGGYRLLIGSEGVLRVTGCVLCAAIGLHEGGAFGFALVVATFGAIALALWRSPRLLAPGPGASWSELSNALGFLVVASLANNFLFSAGPVVIPLLQGPGQSGAAGQFLNARVIAYIPLFFFQAVQAALLPKLAGLAARGHEQEYRQALGRLAGFTALLGILATAGAVLLGPFAVRLLFGSGYSVLGARDLGLLTLSCAGFMLAVVAGQALISLGGYRQAAAGWICGVAAFVAITAAGRDLFLRVEVGLCAGAAAALAVLGGLLLLRLRRGLPEADVDRALAEALPEVTEA
jgi:O-antigen/teichoic acid export membrane protein